MKLKDLVNGQSVVLRLWKSSFMPPEAKSWNIFVDLKASDKVFNDEVAQLMKERNTDESTIWKQVLLQEIHLKSTDDQFSLSSNYFGASVVQISGDSDNRDYVWEIEDIEVVDRKEIDITKFADDNWESLKKICPADSVQIAPLTKDEFAQLEVGRAFSVVVLDVRPERGLDGVTYGLQMGGFRASVQFEWWESGPEEWHELTSWTINTIKFLSEIIKKHSEIP